MFWGVLASAVGCGSKRVRIPVAANANPADNSYVGLKAGSTLRIVVPLLKSGEPLHAVVQQTGDRTLSATVTNFIGYEASRYAVSGNNGKVRLKFQSAEISRDNKTIEAQNPPALPFKLPRRKAHVRLIFLVRISQADHNMAIVASPHLDELNAFTKKLKQDPSVCRTNSNIFCSWVPSGVAVRPEGS